MDQALTLDQIREHGAPKTVDIPIEGLGTVKMREPTGTVMLKTEEESGDGDKAWPVLPDCWRRWRSTRTAP